MNNTITIDVAELIGSRTCIAADDAQQVFDKTKSLLLENKKVTLSFSRVKLMISLFLNVAIGQLYGSFSEEKINNDFSTEGLDDDDQQLLQQVIANAKKYYGNQQGYDAAWENLEA